MQTQSSPSAVQPAHRVDASEVVQVKEVVVLVVPQLISLQLGQQLTNVAGHKGADLDIFQAPHAKAPVGGLEHHKWEADATGNLGAGEWVGE